jgi:hypothetical protein
VFEPVAVRQAIGVEEGQGRAARGAEGVVAADGDGGAGNDEAFVEAGGAGGADGAVAAAAIHQDGFEAPARGQMQLVEGGLQVGQVALLVEGDDHHGQDVLDGIGHGFLGNLVGGPLGLRGHAQQDLDILFGQRAAGEDAADAEHHVVGGVVGHEADVEQGPAPLGEHGLAHGGGAFGGALLRGLEDAGGDEQLVGADHDGHGEVEGFVGLGGGDADELGAEGEVLEREAVVLGAEQDGDGGVEGGGEEGRGPLARRLGVVAVEAAAVGGAGDEPAIGDGLGGGGDDLAVGEDGAGVAGHLAASSMFMPPWARIHEDELGEAHVHHGAAGRSRRCRRRRG